MPHQTLGLSFENHGRFLALTNRTHIDSQHIESVTKTTDIPDALWNKHYNYLIFNWRKPNHNLGEANDTSLPAILFRLLGFISSPRLLSSLSSLDKEEEEKCKMPRHGSQVARERLNILWEKLVCGVATERTPSDGHIEDISDFKIDFHPQFDFESLDVSGPSVEARHKALIWFKPLSEDVFEHFPCRASAQEFFEYATTKKDPRWKVEDRTQAIYTYVNQCTRLREGRGLSTLGIEKSLLDHLRIRIVKYV